MFVMLLIVFLYLFTIVVLLARIGLRLGISGFVGWLGFVFVSLFYFFCFVGDFWFECLFG